MDLNRLGPGLLHAHLRERLQRVFADLEEALSEIDQRADLFCGKADMNQMTLTLDCSDRF